MTALPVAPAGLGDVLARMSALDARLRSVDPGWDGLSARAFGDLLAGGAAGAGDGTGVSNGAGVSDGAGIGAGTQPGAAATGPGDAAGGTARAGLASPGANLTTISWTPRSTQGGPRPGGASGTGAATRSQGAGSASGGVGGLPAVAPGTLVNPVPGARISLPFGPTDFALEPPATVNGITYAHYHDGLDLAAPLGTPVLAAADGTVISAGRVADGAVVVRIRHADGSITLYGHLDPALPVAVGDTVTAGQPIGAIGLTGRTTGPHLHLEYTVNGVNVDPAAAFAPAGGAAGAAAGAAA